MARVSPAVMPQEAIHNDLHFTSIYIHNDYVNKSTATPMSVVFGHITLLPQARAVLTYVVHAGVGSCLAGGCARCAPCHIHGCMGACGAIFMSYCAYAGRMDICWLLQRCRKRYPMPMILALSEQFAWACFGPAYQSLSFPFRLNTIMLCSQQSITSDQVTIIQYLNMFVHTYTHINI